jgi:circadian clock protein KaiC
MKSIAKTKTGINGLDEITGGGLPAGRPTLVCGGPGCGKTLLAIEFIVKGATLYNDPGVFITFEEKAEDLTNNVASLGFDLDKLVKNKKLRLDYVHIDRTEIEETGEYDLDGLFIRLEHAIDSIGAKRVVLDTIENLFAGLTNQGILRAELRRLFQWLKTKGVTAIITGEKGDGTLTRHGLEEYVSDCVILLDHRIIRQVSTRRIRIVKYRGSLHGTNEYPFLIDEEGITIFPVTSLKLDKDVSTKRISTGVASLDKMFGGKGFFRGSSILVSGTSGTGKSSIAAYFADANCRRKEKCLFVALEESPKQIIRNMKSIGLDLDRHVKSGLLEFQSFRPGLHGLEMHLASLYKMVRKFKPQSVVVDPVTNLVSVGLLTEVNAMLLRLIDFMQSEGITLMLTALNSGSTEHLDENVSSLVDAWILVRDLESDGERNRAIYIMKSRGMPHSNEVREFLITSKGLDLVEVYRGPTGVLVGSARKAKMKEEMAFAKKNHRNLLNKPAKKIQE